MAGKQSTIYWGTITEHDKGTKLIDIGMMQVVLHHSGPIHLENPCVCGNMHSTWNLLSLLRDTYGQSMGVY